VLSILVLARGGRDNGNEDAPHTGGGTVELAFKILLMIFSVALIAVVLLQKGKSAGLSGAITGGAEHLFGKQKARGLDLFLQRMTIGIAVGFFVTALIVAYLVKV
jgi:preprotein translocase subunit SecG